ncbi:MAG: RNA-binding protein [Desulfatitalea sp. BRH_c12]|nr:MAG: RNA-binding protein [Desulfatitalea sp. BRH_c12]
MDQLIKFIAQQLVDQPEDVLVSKVEGENITVLELHVGKGDCGKVIGKQGRTAEAMRTILNAVSTKTRKRTILEIIE